MKNARFIPVAATCLVALLAVTYPSTGWAKSTEDKVKDWIDDSVEALKGGLDKLGDDFKAVQDYLDNYHWKGVIEEKATSGPVTLKHLELNKHSRAVIVEPGEKIEAEVECDLDAKQSSIFGVYRVVIGIKGEGPQVVLGNALGLASGESREKFTLIAPDKSGVYQVRFRPVDALFKGTALDAWKDKEGNEPDGKTTIGIIFVK